MGTAAYTVSRTDPCAPLSPRRGLSGASGVRSLGQGTRPARLRGQRSEQEFLDVLSRCSYRAFRSGRSGDAPAECDGAVEGLDLLLDRAELVLQALHGRDLGRDRVLVRLLLGLQAAQHPLGFGDLPVQRRQLPLKGGQLCLGGGDIVVELVE